MSSNAQKRRRSSHTRCARRSLVELTLAASSAIDDGLFVLSSGIAASNLARSEHRGENQTIVARQATAPSPFAVLEFRNAAAPSKDELLDSDTNAEMMVKIVKDYQNRAFENIKASLNAELEHAKDLVETRMGGETASKDIVGSSLESNFLTVLKEAATEFRADTVELIVQKEPADSPEQPQPRYMRRLTDEAVRLLDDLRSGKLENQANFILSECFREAASAFSMINQQLRRDGYAASIDPSIFIWLANITEPETRNSATMRLEIVPNHHGRPSTTARQVAQFIWHLVEGQGCPRQAAYRGAFTKFSVSASFAEKAYAFWEPIFKRAGPRVKMLTRISDPEM
jgi:hypothetical protein